MRALLPLLLPAGVLAAQTAPLPLVELTPGMVITRSVRVAPRTYRLTAAQSLDSAVIVIRGNDLTVDFDGATLEGTPAALDPDRAAGLAIRVEGGRSVVVRNAVIRGYKVGLLARGTRGLTLQGIDASHNWKPRLYSVIEHESLVDWLSYHHNEGQEWRRYGAGLYLEGVTGGAISGSTVEQGMNGLLLTRSDSLRITGNRFAYNSGLGIGLYRSSDNLIAGNVLVLNVRGYSHRFYRRGQDSAALLIYEQSHRNLVAWNTATHGGDGLFLWAGQETMDSGRGGANDNVFFANDFSYAPTNAMEATFSRNLFLGNVVRGSDHGLWGGYSWESKVVGNCFGRNRIGIAIEHGQDNLVAANRFDGDSLAIRLWGDSLEPSDWGYPKHRDTRSRDYRITENTFAGTRLSLQAANTSGLVEEGNRTVAAAGTGCRPGILPAEYRDLVPSLPGTRPVLPANPLGARDRSAIVVDDWGPYDWRSPRLWPVDSARAAPLRLAVLGPPGRWRVVGRSGVATLSATSGRIGDTLTVTPDRPGDWNLELEYRGGATVSPQGIRGAAGAPYRFGWERWEPATDWQVRFFRSTDSSDIRKGIGGTPFLEQRMSRLDFQWYRPRIAGIPLEHWALEAAAIVDLPQGNYRLRTISDDGIRVWVDERLVIEGWRHRESTVDSAAVSGGRHTLRVEYFQDDGWTELSVVLLRSPTSPRSTGGPAPRARP